MPKPVHAPASDLRLRPASADDDRFLFALRRDPVVAAASQGPVPADLEHHTLWLAGVLQDTSRRLYIAEQDGVPVGQGRIDTGLEAAELSWALSPAARGRGLGQALIAALITLSPKPVRAVIRSDNLASRRAAEASGLSLATQESDLCTYIGGANAP